MEKIYVVTYSPPWAEYISICSPVKAFYNETEAKEFIEKETEKEKLSNNSDDGNYEIEEIELQ